MRATIIKITVVLMILLTLWPNFFPILAVDLGDFDPNLIITDEEIQNYSSLNRTEIQIFLEEKKSYLADFRTIDNNGQVRYASDIIYQAAQDYKINPKYLLVKLQKEQSLITDKNPTQRQLDWATGYGVCDSCDTNEQNLQKYKGFFNQVDYAAGIMRWYYQNYAISNYVKKDNVEYEIDKQKITPANLATAFLYTYTPHIHGNQNFWKLWKMWFEQSYPNGSLLKTKRTGVVYLIDQGRKREIKSTTALITRFDPKQVVTIPDSELSKYDNGKPISLPNYSILFDGSSYYLLDDTAIRPFASPEVVKSFGYNPDEIINITVDDLNDYEIGKTIDKNENSFSGEIVYLTSTSQYYFVKNNEYNPLSDPQIAKINFPTLLISTSTEIISNLKIGQPVKFRDGTVIGIKETGNLYVLEYGKKRSIPSREIFNSLQFKDENIVWISEMSAIFYELGQPISAKANELIETGDIGPTYETNLPIYLIADYSSGKILSGKEINKPHQLASLTKVMTAYTLFQNKLNLTKSTTYNPAIHNTEYNNYRLKSGEKVLNKDLLKVLLVSSLNPPAKMLVSSIGFTEQNFVKKMNLLADSWGLTSTRFVDTSGESEDNLTTASEYLQIFQKATKDENLKKYLRLKSYSYNEVLDKDKKPTHSDINSNALLTKAKLPYTILETKTGFLPDYGANLAMVVERKSDKKKFIIITMGNLEKDRFDKPDKLTQWALKNF